ncbi:MAG: hypothetical protein QM500_08960 [Methylococcales bacterium]
MSKSESSDMHRVQLRLRSGENARELEKLAWEEYNQLKTGNEKQRFLSEHFLAGYALNRAGITKDASILGVQVLNSESDIKKPTSTKTSTVNLALQKSLGGLITPV